VPTSCPVCGVLSSTWIKTVRLRVLIIPLSAAAWPIVRPARRPRQMPRTSEASAVAAAVVLMLVAAGVASADPYKWCAVDSSSGGTNCGFVTIEQCRATISGRGGACEPKQVVPPNLSPAAKAAAPKTNMSGDKLMDCVTDSCKINCSPNIAKRYRPKWCSYFKEPV
jgi:Protein of unknown function (DUF3551)